MILVAMVCFGLNASAQTATCKVTNSADNASIVASIDSVDENGNVTVSFSNDGTKPVNVTFKVVYGIHNHSISSTILVPAQSSTTKQVAIGKNNKPAKLELSSARCQ